MRDRDLEDVGPTEVRRSDLEELRAEAIRRLEKFEKKPRRRGWLARKLFGI